MIQKMRKVSGVQQYWPTGSQEAAVAIESTPGKVVACAPVFWDHGARLLINGQECFAAVINCGEQLYAFPAFSHQKNGAFQALNFGEAHFIGGSTLVATADNVEYVLDWDIGTKLLRAVIEEN
jgi:hypothetical protein